MQVPNNENKGTKLTPILFLEGTYLGNVPRQSAVRQRLMSRNKVRVGIVGVGNCASSFVQGLSHYARAESNAPPPGLMNVELGGYHVGDIELATAFDLHASKVGRDVAEAIFADPN